MVTALTASFAFGQGKISSVTAKNTASGVEVLVSGQELTSPKVTTAYQGKSYILEFDAKMAGNGKRLKMDAGNLAYIHYAWFSAKPPKIRVHLRFKNAEKPTLEKAAGGWIVRIGSSQPPKPSAQAPKKEDQFVPYGSPNDVQPAAKPIAKPAPMAAPSSAQTVSHAPIQKPAAPRYKTVSLDFVNTEIVQILKALSMQSKTNIVTAPDLKGALTVSMDTIRLEEALDLVTSLAGLRYAKIGNTFIVAPTDKFAEIMRSVRSSTGEVLATRMVPIYSGQSAKVKAAVMKAFPQDSDKGTFDILLASDEATAEEAKPSSGSSTSAPKKKLNELYVLLVGDQEVLDSVESLIKSVDRSIARAYGISIPTSSDLVRETYLLQSDSMSAKGLINEISALDGTAFRNVELYPSPTTSDRQTILIVGRSTEVEQARATLAEFDAVGDSFLAYDVKYSDPRSLRELLVANVPGLRVTLPPGHAGEPRLYEPGQGTRMATTETTLPGAGGSPSAPLEKGIPDPRVKGDPGGAQSGTQQPFIEAERAAVPMRLILRGSKEQIEKALTYLTTVDVAPKQVALDLRVVEMSKEDALRLGLDWSVLTGGLVQSFRMNQGLGDTASTPGTASGTWSGSGLGTGSVLATLDQLNGSRKILARPNLLALDGRESEVFVGDVVRYIQSIQSTQNGTTVTTGEVRVGVRFAILPRIGDKGKMILDLRPVVSYLSGFTPVPGGGQLPQTSERVAQSTISINSGETIAIGGLIRDEDRKAVSGVPILKDIPLLGQLFKRTDNRHQRTEVVFFLTAVTVDQETRGTAAIPYKNQMERPDPFKEMRTN